MTGTLDDGSVARRDAISRSLAAVESRIQAACDAAVRNRGDVTLIVVTKTFPASDVHTLGELGVTEVGENRDQEASAKATEVAQLGGPPQTWHMIGQLQTNKAKSVVRWADVVHSVDSERLVAALEKAVRNREREALGCLIQVNLDPQASPGRGGAQPHQVPGLADLVASSEALELRGVMAVAPLGADPAQAFEVLQQVSEELKAAHPEASWISAGMSSDLEAAITFGATHLRVGGAVLGNRPPLA